MAFYVKEFTFLFSFSKKAGHENHMVFYKPNTEILFRVCA
jgi:hypothetical protein